MTYFVYFIHFLLNYTLNWKAGSELGRRILPCTEKNMEARYKVLINVVKNFEKVLALAALTVTKSSVNSYCLFFMYEPELPVGAERLKKGTE